MITVIITTCSVIGVSQTIKDIATDVTDPNNLADTEPSIAVDPSNPLRIAIVSFSEPWGAGNINAPVWVSTDGGNSWTKLKQIPQPPTQLLGPGDQKVAFDSTGRVLIAELDFGLNDFVYRQAGAPTSNLTAGSSYGNDQPHLDVDKISTSPCFNHVYSPWLNTSASPARSNVERSDDFGVTVANVAAGDSGLNNRTTRIAVAPNGKAYIIYKTREGAIDSNFESAHFRVMRSDDCGATWTAIGDSGVAVHSGTAVTWFTNNFGNPAKGKVGRARSSDAWIAADPSSGDIYAAFVNRDSSGLGQIFVARSVDQGLTWSSTRITDGTHHSAYPEIAVAGNGTVGVLYIDFDDSGSKTIFRHRLALSFDHNSTWSSSNLQNMDPGPIANASSGFLWGDYEGLTAVGNTFYGVFTGQSIGRTVLQLDPIFFKVPAFKIMNICKAHPEICHGVCTVPNCRIINPLEKYCAAGACPGCAGGMCPFYRLIIEDLGDPWVVQIVDPTGTPVKTQQTRTSKGTIVSFRPSREFAGEIGEYQVVFKGAKAGSVLNVTPRLDVR
ncbi:MAG TPA: sialidase family protein [Terriglobales bacterium]|nr:sialidase family protein [Terriglobales bacterium]